MLFSSHINNQERKVNRFFERITEQSHVQHIHRAIEQLIQEDVVVLNIWLEKRFKNYRYLSKRKRAELYRNAKKIAQTFNQFLETYPTTEAIAPQLQYLQAIAAFLKPGKYYQYIQSASFGKLLQDPQRTVLQGDCNQIVTLYIFLYALRYPVTDLQLKLLPDHVCLHYAGQDIEATNGQFTVYDQYEYLAPISELVSINLLDVNDFREQTSKISPRSLVKSAQLAHKVSTMRALVERNLRVSYHHLAVYALEQGNIDTALFYSRRVNDPRLIEYVYHTAIDRYSKQHQYSKARYYAQQINNPQLIRILYQREYNQALKKVQHLRTLPQMKKNKVTYRKLIELARKGGLTEQQTQLQNLLRQLK